VLRTPSVEDIRVETMSVSSSRSSSGSEAEEDDIRGPVFPVGWSFLRAADAQRGVGLIFSYCPLRRRSYSRPPTASSDGASRSFRSRLLEARETCNVASSGSIQAGALLDLDTGVGLD